jgi:hypothetical protein
MRTLAMLAAHPFPALAVDFTVAHKALHTMKTISTLELADIKKIAAAAEAEALRNQWAVTIAIVDAGGHLLWLQRLDGAAPVCRSPRLESQPWGFECYKNNSYLRL